ncbi:MAG: hypothetical protein KA797_08820 [Chitinophagales bacterium]|nr:hypothetical protein [Chitinophagales bacterium]
MKTLWISTAFLFFGSLTAQTSKAKSSINRYQTLPQNYFEQLKKCNGVDLVIFATGKSMEFSEKNAQLPVTFIAKSSVKSIDGLRLLGLIMYKIDQKSFIDCDILANKDNSIVVLKLKTLDKKVYYNQISPMGLETLKSWLK